MLQGCLIPIINTTFIELSTTAYLTSLYSMSYPKTQPLDSLDQECPKSNLLHCLSPIYRRTKLPRRVATLLPTTRMVVHGCSDSSTPGSRYCRVDRNETRIGRCGLNVLLPIEKANLRITRLSVAECIQIVSSVAQT